MRIPVDRRTWVIALIAIVLFVFAIRVTGPEDLEDNSQARNVGYVLDLLEHGHWLVQHDLNGRIMSKPPLHTWLVGIGASFFGLNRLTLTLPSFFAVMGMVLLVFRMGCRRFGLLSGGLAGLGVVMTPLLWRQVGMVRSDALFALAIAGGAWAAFRAWESGRGWVWFWVLAAVAVLTKGPLGILLSSAGLLAWFWEGRGRKSLRPEGGGHLRGILYFLLICLMWVGPALWFNGRELIDKLIYQELLGHVVTATAAEADVSLTGRFLEPTLNFMIRFVPFSLFAAYGMFRVFRAPSSDEGERRLERFLTCWILAGLLVFTIASHHRADLLLPLWPAGALLAGREIARLSEGMRVERLAWVVAGLTSLMLVVQWCKYHPVGGRMPSSVRGSQLVREAAMGFRATGIDPSGVRNLGSPITFQYYLGTAEMKTTVAEIVKGRVAGEKIWVSVPGGSVDDMEFPGSTVVEVFRWPIEVEEQPVVRVLEITWDQPVDAVRG